MVVPYFGQKKNKNKKTNEEDSVKLGVGQSVSQDEKTYDLIRSLGGGAAPTDTKLQPTNPEVIRNEFGGITGLALPNGAILQGLTPEQVQAEINNYNKKIATPAGAIEAKQGAAIRTAQKEALRAVQPSGSALTAEQMNRDLFDKNTGLIDTATTAAAAIGGGIAGAKTGAGVGAALAPITGGLSIPIAAGIGAGVGAVGGAFVKISYQEKNNIKKAMKVYAGSKSNLQYLLNEVNSGRLTGMAARDAWNNEIANILAAQRNIHRLNQNELDRFLGGGADEEAQINSFVARLPLLERAFEQALLTPNPNSIMMQQEGINIDENG